MRAEGCSAIDSLLVRRLASQSSLTRRSLFSRIGGGFGALGLASVLADAGILMLDGAAERRHVDGHRRARFSRILWLPGLPISPRGPSG